MLGIEKQPKQKLTLAIDKEIIEKAKNAGINISSITEKVLESITLDVKGATRQDIDEGYHKFFEVIKNVLEKYGAEVEVGVEQQPDGGEPVMLTSGGLWADDYEGPGRHFVKETDFFYFSAFKILENLVKALISAAEQNTEELKELEIALRFVKALSNEGVKTE